MLEKQEAGFDQIEITAEMDVQRFRTGFDSEPLNTKPYNPRWPHTQAEYTLEINVEVKGLKMKSAILQPAPSPQDDLSPRRSPAVGTGLNEPGPPHAESQSTDREDIFSPPASLDGVLYVSCLSLEQGITILLQADVGANDEISTTKSQAATCKEFARLPIGRQQRETASTKQSKQFDPGG